MIANTIITAALRKLLVVPSGGTPTTNQLADGLEVLNDLVNSWSAQSDVVYENVLENLTIPVGTQSFTIGATGDQVTARPLKILVATLSYSSTEYPMVIIDSSVYPNFSNKSSSGQPFRIYFRKTWPNATIYFEYTTDKAYTLILTSMKQLSTFSDGTTDVELPDHYERALKANLVIELADEMGAGNRVTGTMMKIAEESKSAVIGQAINITESMSDIPHRGAYNINSDDY